MGPSLPMGPGHTRFRKRQGFFGASTAGVPARPSWPLARYATHRPIPLCFECRAQEVLLLAAPSSQRGMSSGCVGCMAIVHSQIYSHRGLLELGTAILAMRRERHCYSSKILGVCGYPSTIQVGAKGGPSSSAVGPATSIAVACNCSASLVSSDCLFVIPSSSAQSNTTTRSGPVRSCPHRQCIQSNVRRGRSRARASPLSTGCRRPSRAPRRRDPAPACQWPEVSPRNMPY